MSRIREDLLIHHPHSEIVPLDSGVPSMSTRALMLYLRGIPDVRKLQTLPRKPPASCDNRPDDVSVRVVFVGHLILFELTRNGNGNQECLPCGCTGRARIPIRLQRKRGFHRRVGNFKYASPHLLHGVPGGPGQFKIRFVGRTSVRTYEVKQSNGNKQYNNWVQFNSVLLSF